MGGTSKPKQVGTADLSSPEQSGWINQILGPLTQQGQQAYGQFLEPYDPEQFQGLFQQAFIDPAMQTYEQDVLPSIQQRFEGANAGSSSALNQALASSASDLSTSLGSQMGQFYQQNEQNKLGALGQMGGLAGQKILDPLIQKPGSVAGDSIGAGGDVLSALVNILPKLFGLG